MRTSIMIPSGGRRICARSKRRFFRCGMMRAHPGKEAKPMSEQQAGDPMKFGPFGAALEYWVDAAQRSVLFWDVMRQRGNQYREHLAETVPHVLDYAAELVMDGRTLAR